MKIGVILCVGACAVLVLTSAGCANGDKNESSASDVASVSIESIASGVNSEISDEVLSEVSEATSSKLLSFRNILKGDTFSYSKTSDDSTTYIIKTPDVCFLKTGVSAQIDTKDSSYYVALDSKVLYKYDNAYQINLDSILNIVSGLKNQIGSGSDIINGIPYVFESYEREFYSEYLNENITVESTYYFNQDDKLCFVRTDNNGRVSTVTINSYSDSLSDEELSLLDIKNYKVSDKSAESILSQKD